ncbi:hypothetical protein [Bdellovibrio bacteriovorus]|uniref:Uncharacterized protein n=1 Tax=Bdellovibrio bacteriovorus str. Tiberius TaxID=1069642 RepID=K7YRG8_BDEBC|nr:hypothetical protein [Bdellovibrio bacteriovorus]AFY00193.1 hypothetical protein Bdt_0485 [Bdellovibrio bacteriovorus str. Tiberius]
MKKLVMAAMILMGSSAMADSRIMTCVVPSETNAVTLAVDLADDQSADFVMVNLNERTKSAVFFSQMDKGTIAQQLQNGFLNLLALTEKSSQVDGVITNTGFLGLSLESDGTFGGFLAANGNIYPLSCTK